jgi:hypothetical protein
MEKIIVFFSLAFISLQISPQPLQHTNSYVAKPGSNKDAINQNELVKQLIELLQYSKDGFKKIKGGKLKTEINKSSTVGESTDYYSTSYSLTGAVNNDLEEMHDEFSDPAEPDIVFKASYGKSLSKTDGENQYDKLLAIIKAAFTTGYNVKEKNNDLGNGSYYKKLEVVPKNDENHYIQLGLTVYSGLQGGDQATVEIKIK